MDETYSTASKESDTNLIIYNRHKLYLNFLGCWSWINNCFKSLVNRKPTNKGLPLEWFLFKEERKHKNPDWLIQNIYSSSDAVSSDKPLGLNKKWKSRISYWQRAGKTKHSRTVTLPYLKDLIEKIRCSIFTKTKPKCDASI